MRLLNLIDMNKTCEIDKFFDRLDLPTTLSKWLYLERLTQDEMLIMLEREPSPTLIRSYFQLTSYFNYCIMTKHLDSKQLARLSTIRIEINNEMHPLVYWLSLYALLQVPDLGIADRDLAELKERTIYYILYVRPVLLNFMSDEN